MDVIDLVFKPSWVYQLQDATYLFFPSLSIDDYEELHLNKVKQTDVASGNYTRQCSLCHS